MRGKKSPAAVLGLVIFVAGLLLASCGVEDTENASNQPGSGSSESLELNDDSIVVGPVPNSDLSGPTELDEPLPEARLMYVSVSKDNLSRVVRLEQDGTMTALVEHDLVFPGRTGAMALGRSTNRLYLGVGESFATIEVGDDGSQKLLGLTPVEGEPVFFDLAKNDRQLVSAYFGEDVVALHKPENVFPTNQVDKIGTTEEPHASVFGPSEQLLYVPHRRGNTVSWFVVNDKGLQPLGEVEGEPDAGPRHIVFNPEGDFAYVVNEFASSVSTFAVGKDGSLSLVETVSALPNYFGGTKNTGADIHITPDGKYVYSSNRGHDSIAGFAVNNDGTLKYLANTMTEARPREFDISPDGKFLVVAGQDSGNIASYSIDETGMLTELQILAVGDSPVWVTIR